MGLDARRQNGRTATTAGGHAAALPRVDRGVKHKPDCLDEARCRRSADEVLTDPVAARVHFWRRQRPWGPRYHELTPPGAQPGGEMSRPACRTRRRDRRRHLGASGGQPAPSSGPVPTPVTAAEVEFSEIRCPAATTAASGHSSSPAAVIAPIAPYHPRLPRVGALSCRSRRGTLMASHYPLTQRVNLGSLRAAPPCEPRA